MADFMIEHMEKQTKALESIARSLAKIANPPVYSGDKPVKIEVAGVPSGSITMEDSNG